MALVEGRKLAGPPASWIEYMESAGVKKAEIVEETVEMTGNIGYEAVEGTAVAVVE